MSLLQRFRNLSYYKGKEYAYNVSADALKESGGSIYDGNSYTAIRPIKYMDEDGVIHPFTDEQASDPEFSNLILRSGNAYTFAQDGYGAYFSANLSVTKEISDKLYKLTNVRNIYGNRGKRSIYSYVLLWFNL